MNSHAKMFLIALACCACPVVAQAEPAPPNIVLILADDIGYGDVGCYGAQHVKTPNIDRLAAEGIRLTDAHATAAVCTPTRYAILTGQYAFRNPDADHILSGIAPLAITPDTHTLPSLLHDAGYVTGLVGKWHLGLGSKDRTVDFNGDIAPGPLDVGFGHAFFIPATGDRVPCVYVENRRVVGLDARDPIAVSYGQKVGEEPTGSEHPELLRIQFGPGHDQTIVNGISRIGYMTGGKAARWTDETIADTLTARACAFIEKHSSQPFFLYFAPHDIHEPMAPNPRFKGSSDCGSRGDVIQELDWSVGEVLSTLDRLHLDNTLVVFSSDNGGAIKDTYDDGTNTQHTRQPPNGILRGEKGQLYEGGHRVPFIARWPNHIAAGATSGDLVGLVDLSATVAALVGKPLPGGAAPDSFNLLPALLPAAHTPPRDHLVLQANNAALLALREGPWCLVPKRKGKDVRAMELYNLESDLTQVNDVAREHPEITERMLSRLTAIRNEPQTRP